MAKNGDAERRRLFDLYAAQFVAGGCTPDDCFVCPLCRDGYLRPALDGPDPAVSLAHVVPRSQGGKHCTLTCTACNNGNGAGLESDLLERFRYDDWAAGVGEWPIRLSGAFGEIGAALRIREPGPPVGLSIYAEERRSDRRTMAALLGGASPFAGPDGDSRWTFRWSVRHRPGRIGAAIYQSAYLMMFAHFGYDFAFRDQYEPLRQQIFHPDEAIWPGRVFVLSADDFRSPLLRREGAVMFVRQPEPCVAVLLRFHPPEGRERVLGVLLPGPEADDGRVPLLEPGPLDGAVVPYRPEVLASRTHHFAELWRRVQVPGR